MSIRQVGLCLAALLLLVGAPSVLLAAAVHDAARAGDVQKLTALLEAKPELITAKDEGGWTPLHYAASKGRKEAVALLLARGAPVNAKTGWGGDTALSLAVDHEPSEERESIERTIGSSAASEAGDTQSYRDIVAMLLENHAEVNIRDSQGETPLHKAAFWGHEETAQLLCEHGAEVNVKGRYGTTPLHEAARFGKPGVAKVLLSHGANVDAKDRNGATPLFAAAWSGDLAMVQLLLDSGADVNARDEAGVTAVYNAAVRGAAEVVKLFLDRGYRVKSIQDAVLVGDVGEVRQFLAADRRLANSRLGHGGKETPTLLHIAAAAGRAEVAELLLSQGANPNAKAEWGMTPLHEAAYMSEAGTPEVAKVLLAHGAKVEARDVYSQTPLHLAAHSGRARLVAVLLAAGANPNARDEEGKTPLHHAVPADQELLGRARTANDLAGKPVSEVVSALNQAGRRLAIDVLVSGGADINAKDSRGVTPLHAAAYSGYADAVDVLLARGADARAKANDGMTPLHEVASGGGDPAARRRIADSLIAKGADVHAKNGAGRTPLDLAMAKGEREMTELLRGAGSSGTGKQF